MGLGTDHAPAAPRPRRLGLRRCARGASSPSRIALSVVRSEPLVAGDHRPLLATQRGKNMKSALLLSLLLGVTAVYAADPVVTPLMTKPLPEFPGKEVFMFTVEYPPGSADPVHKHKAHGFIYVLEGSIVMAVNGGEPVTLTPGQTFYEGPTDIHTIGRNASQTKPAKFLVLLLKDVNAPVLIPVK
jgi:quercetin dioxygenase-like cupin family protein